MNIALGIDTGGTYTDAALIDQESGEVLAGAKSLTTRHDLSLCGNTHHIYRNRPSQSGKLSIDGITI